MSRSCDSHGTGKTGNEGHVIPVGTASSYEGECRAKDGSHSG